MQLTPFKYNTYYHIYNRGINGCKLFHMDADCQHFLALYDKYISTVANTYAWVLMGNHFHFLIQTKKEEDIGYYKSLNSDRSVDSVRFSTTNSMDEHLGIETARKPNISRHFSHLFSAYSKYFNTKYKRSGSLFERPFRRIEIKHEVHLKYLVYYIHHNPVHHACCDDMLDYPWSSYLSILSPKETKLKRGEVLRWYRNRSNFQGFHNQKAIDRYDELNIDVPGNL